jgi:hypothetical protein
VPDLLRPLKATFGYSTFRPLQREIIEASLAGRDTFALLPTAAANRSASSSPRWSATGLTVVASPLIALMKDQVDALQASGVAATFLNSTLDETAARARLRGPAPRRVRAPLRRARAPDARRLAGEPEGVERRVPSRSTRRTACPSGATISGRSTASW